jgi:hypothetical protein
VSAATPTGPGTPIDRRTLLRGGLVGTAALALAAVGQAPGTGLVGDVASRFVGGGLATGRSPAVAGPLPSAEDWQRIVGHDVTLGLPTGATVGAQVVDVRDVTRPTPHARLEGEAYSLLLDAPSLPDESSVVVSVHHEALDAPSLVLLPVNGDGSWEATVDRRTSRTTP